MPSRRYPWITFKFLQNLNKRWLTLPICILNIISFAQTDSSYLHFLYENIRDGQSKGTIHYASNLKPFEIKDWSPRLNKKQVTGWVSQDDYDTIILSRKERKYIQQQLKASLDSSWPDQLFPDSKLIPADSIDKYTRRYNLAIARSSVTDQQSATYLSRWIWGFRFSRPVYLRNNSLLISYLKRFAMDGGEENVIVYRRDSNSWKRWMLIDGSAW
jgi:hypothetical protein